MTATRSSALRESALWGTAAVVVLAAHLGSALWLLRQAEAAAPPGLPEPVFVELAPAPMAAAPLEEVETPEMAEAEPEPVPDFVLNEPLPEIEPPDMDTLFPPPPEAVVLQKSERPKDRPEPKEPEKIVRKEPEKPREKKEKAPEEQQARKAATTVRAPQGDRSAAPAAGQPSARQEASWQSKVQSAVARHMRRVSNLRKTGVTVTVAFTIGADGRVSGGRVLSSTGDARTDAALARQASRMPRLPAPPDGKARPITLPVRITPG